MAGGREKEGYKRGDVAGKGELGEEGGTVCVGGGGRKEEGETGWKEVALRTQYVRIRRVKFCLHVSILGLPQWHISFFSVLYIHSK